MTDKWKPIPESDIPQPALDAFGASWDDPSSVEYCNFCDGFRLKGHTCVCLFCHEDAHRCDKCGDMICGCEGGVLRCECGSDK